ncbi:MAG TPA: hypothetical protein VI341_06090, partial [Actinomycetota bacterium]
MTTATPSARRKRTFLILLAVLALATVAFALLSPRADTAAIDEPALAEHDEVASGETHPIAPPPPAYLAWISGGFTSDFRAQVRTEEAFTATVVVAGDTRWMTRSTDADGKVVDDPMGPFAFPIDAFAVNPVEYAP